MCGITGIYTKNKNKDYSREIHTMNDAIIHRGPDADGFFTDKKTGVYLGNRRLRIIDLNKRADQPMYSESKDIVLTYNGEVYNHLELRGDLEKKGYKYNSTSDTETILYGYMEYGTKIFEKLDGVFGLAIWDSKKQKLIIARDRIGIVPLYYINTAKCFAFSSEAKSFRHVDIEGWKKELDLDIFKLLLGFMYNFHPQKTLVKGIKKVKPGTFIEIDKSGVKTTTYYKLKIKKSNISYEDATVELERLLKNAVRKRVFNCDVPQGVLLSGGLDSSTIAAMAADISGKERVKTFTAISDSRYDERKYARVVAKHIGSEHTEVYMDNKGILESLDEIVETYDDLSSVDPGITSTRLLSHKIRKLGMRVVLVGEGADEVFGGYSWYGLSKFPFNVIPAITRDWLYYYVISRVITKYNFFSFHSKKLHEMVQNHKYPIFDQIAAYEIIDQLPNHFNLKVNKGNMANGVESRVPYLDYQLVEFVTSLPVSYKLKGPFFNHWMPWEKTVLRSVAAKYLPEEIYSRKKRGFMLSMMDTINANKDYVRKRIYENKEVITKVISEKHLDWLFTEANNKIISDQKEFMTWRLLLFSVWYDYFFKK